MLVRLCKNDQLRAAAREKMHRQKETKWTGGCTFRNGLNSQTETDVVSSAI